MLHRASRSHFSSEAKCFIIMHGRRLALPGSLRKCPMEGQPMQGKSSARRSREAIRPISASIAYLPLQNGLFTLIDAEDADWLSHYTWTIKSGNYVCCPKYGIVNGKRRIPTIHRLILNAPSGVLVDHKNGDSLDNRRTNLRLATCSDNQHNRRRNKNNTSGYKGVSWYRPTGRWTANIKANGRQKHLGLYDSPAEAHAAYCRAARELHQEFARTI